MSIPIELNMVISSPPINNCTQPIHSSSSEDVHNLYIPNVCTNNSFLNNTQSSKAEVIDCANDMVYII